LPADSSSMNGSSSASGMLTLVHAGTFASTGPSRPPLPAYERRVTWTFREPSTRPG
jgi:hypothetical protein